MKTKTAPGETPENNNPAAMGVDAVAQMYMGTPIAAITINASSPSPHCSKNS